MRCGAARHGGAAGRGGRGVGGAGRTLMTWPVPILKDRGRPRSYEESNTAPLVRVPR